jgi:cell division transport system permease protein
MTDMPAVEQVAVPSAPAKSWGGRRAAPIVPEREIARNALMLVVAIMTFLSCLTLGAVTLVRDTSASWQTQIAREATIQIRPEEGLDMEAALEEAAGIARDFAGVNSVQIVDREATARLLEPWLGSGLDLDGLPVPRLVTVTIDRANPPDFEAMRSLLTERIRTASLDDHRTWADRLVAMARSTVMIGVAVLGLILAATMLTVVFATRGAMAGNGHVIEVLHFVGAEARFIAAEFRRHFLITGMKGAAIGGGAAAVAFAAFGFWAGRNLATPEADQATALFGNFAIGAAGYAGVAVIVIAVAALTAVTTHLTVIAFLKDLDVRQPDS